MSTEEEFATETEPVASDTVLTTPEAVQEFLLSIESMAGDARMQAIRSFESALVEQERAAGFTEAQTTDDIAEAYRRKLILDGTLKKPRIKALTDRDYIWNIREQEKKFSLWQAREVEARFAHQAAAMAEREREIGVQLEAEATRQGQLDQISWNTRATHGPDGEPITFSERDAESLDMVREKTYREFQGGLTHEISKEEMRENEQLELSFFQQLADSQALGDNTEVQVSPTNEHSDVLQHFDGWVSIKLPVTNDAQSRKIRLATDFTVSGSLPSLAEKLHYSVANPFVTSKYDTADVPKNTTGIRVVFAVTRDRIKTMSNRYYLERAADTVGPAAKVGVPEVEDWRKDYLWEQQIPAALLTQLREQVSVLQERQAPEEFLVDHVALVAHLERLLEQKSARAVEVPQGRGRRRPSELVVADPGFVHAARVNWRRGDPFQYDWSATDGAASAVRLETSRAGA